MKADEVISKAEHFARSFAKTLLDENEQPEKKQVFLMDNQEVLHKYLGALQKIMETTAATELEAFDDDIEILVQRAQEVTSMLKETLSNYQSELMVQPDVTEETTTAVLTEETIKEAMKTNKTTQEIKTNMTAIAEQKAAPAIMQYTHVLVCDGQSYFIFAMDKNTLESQINSIVGTASFKDIQLFELKLTPVPLHKRTVLTV